MPLGAFKQWRGVMATLHRGNPRHIRMEPWVDWLLCCSMYYYYYYYVPCLHMLLVLHQAGKPSSLISHDLDTP